MTTTNSSINALDKNQSIPFVPSESWRVTALVDNSVTPVNSQQGEYFSYVQAFFDANQVTEAILAVFSGKFHADGSPIINPVQFAYSGERMQIKGVLLLTGGDDKKGNTITSTPIGADPSTDLTTVYVYGGTQ